MDDSDWHICSFIVQFLPKDAPAIAIEISSIEEAEIVAMSADEGKLILLMESEDADILYQKIQSVQDIPGVLAVSLVYHQQENENNEVST